MTSDLRQSGAYAELCGNAFARAPKHPTTSLSSSSSSLSNPLRISEAVHEFADLELHGPHLGTTPTKPSAFRTDLDPDNYALGNDHAELAAVTESLGDRIRCMDRDCQDLMQRLRELNEKVAECDARNDAQERNILALQRDLSSALNEIREGDALLKTRIVALEEHLKAQEWRSSLHTGARSVIHNPWPAPTHLEAN